MIDYVTRKATISELELELEKHKQKINELDRCVKILMDLIPLQDMDEALRRKIFLSNKL